jgi:hypothetical protein
MPPPVPPVRVSVVLHPLVLVGHECPTRGFEPVVDTEVQSLQVAVEP